MNNTNNELPKTLPEMTLRDWFAGQALVGKLAHGLHPDWEVDDVTRSAYLYADSMMDERSEEY